MGRSPEGGRGRSLPPASFFVGSFMASSGWGSPAKCLFWRFMQRAHGYKENLISGFAFLFMPGFVAIRIDAETVS
jgi:hypothetical protein